MNKIVKIAFTMLLFLSLIALCFFLYLYTHGLSGLNPHTEPKNGEIRVACVGDSVTYGHGISGWAGNHYPARLGELLGDGYHVENFGHSGATLSPDGDQPYVATDDYKASLEYKADIVIIMLGSNDSKPENWVGQLDFAAKYIEFMEAYREVNPEVRFILCTPPRAFLPEGAVDGLTNYDIRPEQVETVRYEVMAIALAGGYDLVDIYAVTDDHPEWFKDNVHPSNDGAAAIASAIADMIIKGK